MKTNLLLLILLFCCSLPLYAQIRITEFMYSSRNSGSGEFVELTNVGNSPINLTGWSFDDDHRTPGFLSISGFGAVQPGESVIITDADPTQFRSFWNLSSSVKVLGGSTHGLGQSDEINIYNGSTLVDRLIYTTGTNSTLYKSAWTTAVNVGMNLITQWVLSAVGDAQNSYSASTGDLGNPGRYIGTPVCANAPTIRVASTTTKFINLPTENSGSVSGLIGDPTDPARTLGINFLLADPNTPVNSLTVTATSNNTNVTPNLTGTGATRNLKITPTAVGYATVRVTVSDGTCTANYLLNYAASAASVTQNTTRSRFHTSTSDASTAVLVDGTYMLVADDENQLLRLYDRANSGLPVAGFNFTSSLQLTDKDDIDSLREVDIEASIRQNNRIFWFGSQSNKEGNPGKYRPNRNRVFATDVTGNGATTKLTYAGRYDRLKEDIINWDVTNRHGKGANYYGLQASTALDKDAKSSEGYNIEGAELAPDGTTAYIGFRAPQILPTNRQKALIIPVTNLASLITSPSGSVSATFGKPIDLDLGGRGIREIRRNIANQYVIIAGPAGEATGVALLDFRLYTWTGNANDKPVERTADLTALNANGSFESIVEVPNPLTSTSQLQLLVDNGNAVYYTDGVMAKDLDQPNFKKFRSDLVLLGAPVNMPPTVANGIDNQVGRVNQPFSYTVKASTFTDSETPNALTLNAVGLPMSLSFVKTIISGTPSVSGISTVTVTATDPAGLSVSTQFTITVNPAPLLTVGAPTYDCKSGELSFNTTAGDGSPIEYQITGMLPAPNWTANSTFVLPLSLRTDTTLGPLTLMARQSGRVFTFPFDLKVCRIKLEKPTYDCKSGLLTDNTRGGTGDPIEYKVAGVVSFNLNKSVVIPLWIRTDATRSSLKLTARQSGWEDTLTFNIQRECPVAPGQLELIAPTYSCSTGALTVNTRGGNTTAMEYMIAGVRNWAANPTFSISASLRKSAASLTLSVRQSGVITSAEFDLGDFCNTAPLLEIVTPTYNCADGTLTINSKGGNTTTIEYSIPGVKNWSTSPKFTIPLWIRTDETSDPLVLLIRQSGVICSYVFDSNRFCPELESISLLAPTYDCKTGELSFQVSGGTGSLVEYMISGVTGWSKEVTHTVPARFRTKSYLLTNPNLLLLARQGGLTTSYIFELDDFCKGLVDSTTLELLEPSYICKTGDLSLYISGGNGSLIDYMIPGIRGWSKNPNFIISAALRNNPNSQPLILLARQSGEIISTTFDFREFCQQDFPFEMVAPNYVCQTGHLTIYTMRGTGTKIDYMIPGVRGYSTNPNFVVPAALRNNPNSQPLTLLARQNGVVVSTLFDFREFCRTGILTVLPPSYTCTTGKLTINTSGGNGSLIEYMVSGIGTWSRNRTVVIPAATRNNPTSPPLNLLVRQGGVLANSVFNFRSFCSGSTARLSAEETIEPVEDLHIQVLGNPVKNEVVVEIGGGVGKPLTIRLLDEAGRLVDTRSIPQAGEIERVEFDVSQQQRGILILHVMTAQQAKAVRLLKQ